MAVRTNLVVSRADDVASADAHRRLRLEHGCGLGLPTVAHWAFGVWRSDGVRLPRTAESLSAVIAARPAHRHAREAARAAAGKSGAGIVVPGAGAGCVAADTAGVSEPLTND